jgi:hypothetical protein
MAPLSHEDAWAMVHSIKGAALLTGARGSKQGDVDALADMLVSLGQFAVAHAGRFRTLDLNPIIIKPRGEGVVAVDIAVEALEHDPEKWKPVFGQDHAQSKNPDDAANAVDRAAS